MRFVVTRTSSFKKLLRDVGVDFPDGEKNKNCLWKYAGGRQGQGGEIFYNVSRSPPIFCVKLFVQPVLRGVGAFTATGG